MPISLSVLRSGLFICLAIFSLIVVQQPALTAESEQKRPRRAVSTYETYNREGMGRSDSSISTMQAEMASKSSDVNRAIKMGRRAVELDPEDVDARIALGEALYDKLKSSKKENPAIYNECVKTWLLVYRNLIGAERGLTIKGIGIPGTRAIYSDEEHGDRAKNRLIALCGRTPKLWETNKKFLDKVLQAETSVAGQVVRKSGDRDENK